MELFAHHTPSHSFSSGLIFGGLAMVGLMVVIIYLIMKEVKK